MKRNHAHVGSSAIPCPSVLRLIVHVLARQRNCWLSTTRKPKVHHLSRQANTINDDRKAKGDSDGRNSKRVTGSVTCNGFVTREFVETSDETKEQHERSSKHARTAKKGVETIQEV